MEKEELTKFILNHIEAFCAENDIDCDSIEGNTRLMGSGGIFDSMDLVTFVVEIEEALEDECDIEITLTDEKAMSRRTSPFINPETLTSYILERINEQ